MKNLKTTDKKYNFLPRKNRRLFLFSLIAISLFTAFFFAVPRPLFDDPYSTVVESSDGSLLGARIAADEQWRFPKLDSVPEKYEKCLLHFEDKYFYYPSGNQSGGIGSGIFSKYKIG